MKKMIAKEIEISILAAVLVLSAIFMFTSESPSANPRILIRSAHEYAGNDRSAAVPEAKIASNSKASTSHAPIYINGNSEFSATNGVTGGNGTQSNPYIIENWDINASTANGIEIRNTSAYFVIRNCCIYDGKSNYKYGVYFYNVINGKIENCQIYNNSYGIGLGISSSNTISACTIYNNYYGVFLWVYSSDNQIINCVIYNNFYGICANYAVTPDIPFSSYNDIHYNNIYNNTNYGVYNYNSGYWYCVNATNNWWGSANGPSGVGPGSGDAVSSNVLYDPWFTSELKVYLYHTPIYINGNDQFTSENGVSVGDGSALNPYIIENWDIDASSAYGIRIENTNAYFIIRNCVIHDGKSNYNYGIYFYNVNYGTINNVTSYNNWYGIMLWSSSNNNVTNCAVYNNSYGIYLYYSSNNNITGNTFTNNGIVIWGYNLEDYIHNIDISNTVNGKLLYYYKNQNNVVIDNTAVGQLILVNCTRFDIKNINITNADLGIELAYSSNNNITNCVVYSNPYGILLSYSSNNNVTNCIVYNNSYGIYLYYSLNNNVTNCAVYNNFWDGILLYSSSNNNIITNCAVYNNWCGIYLGSSSNNNVITNCAVYNNSFGIELRCSSNNIITNCTVYNNSYGIELDEASNNQVHYCNIYNNTEYGVYNYNSESQYQVNATYNWWGSANGPYHSTNPSGAGNAVSDNVIYNPWLVEPLDFTPLTVIQTSPNNNEIDVPVDTMIVITFSKSMNTSTIPGNITIEPAVQIQNYVWSSNNKTLTLILASNLSSFMQYTIIINTNIRDEVTDSNGVVHSIENMQEPYQFSFRTKDITPPIANANVDREVNEDELVELNASLSFDNVGIINWTWSFVEQGNEMYLYGEIVYYAFAQPGIYQIMLNVSDAAGNWDTDTVVITVKDITPPDIADIQSAPSTQEVYSYVNITCTVIDNIGVNAVKLNITYPNGETENITMMQVGSNSYSYNTSYSVLGTYSYYIWADDINGNQNKSATYQFIITTQAQNTTKPVISNVQAAPSTQTQGGAVNITCIVTDNVAVSEVKVSITGPAGFTPLNITMTKIQDTDNYYYNSTYSIPGEYSYYIWANDTSNNGNESVTCHFSITAPSAPTSITEFVDGKEVNITGIYTGTINVTSVALPQAPPENLHYIGILVDVTITGTLTYANITIKYNNSDVENIDETKLRMYYWDGSQWQLCNNSGVDTVNNIVWANVTHLTIFAPMAERVSAAGAAPAPVNLFLYAGITAVIVILAVSLIVIMKRRKKLEEAR